MSSDERDLILTPAQLQDFLGIPYFDYNKVTHKNERGFTVVSALESKSNKKPYPPLLSKTKALLDWYYRDHNAKLATLIAEKRVSLWR